MTRETVYCDRCNPTGRSAADTYGRGVHEGNWTSAQAGGWEPVGEDQVCLHCLDEEEARQNRGIVSQDGSL